jgi:preprotein translocase subunit SecE
MAAETTPTSAPTNAVTGWWAGVRGYIDELKGEMRKVSWPTRAQVEATTAVVVISVFLFAAYFALVDAVLGQAINRVFHALAGR